MAQQCQDPGGDCRREPGPGFASIAHIPALQAARIRDQRPLHDPPELGRGGLALREHLVRPVREPPR